MFSFNNLAYFDALFFFFFYLSLFFQTLSVCVLKIFQVSNLTSKTLLGGISCGPLMAMNQPIFIC